MACSTRRPLARTALVSAALTVAGLTSLGTPASGVSDALLYNCTVEGVSGTQVFSAVINTDAPSTLATGLTASISTTTDVTVPANVVDAVRTLGADSVGGSATATGFVDGVARDTSLTIPTTPIPAMAGSTMVLTGSGTSGSITAGPVGSTIALTAGDFSGTMTGYDGASVIAVAAFDCDLQPSQNTLVDAVTVVAVPTTTTVTVQGTPIEYGDTPNVTASVSVSGSNAKPAGTIAFTYGGKTVTVDVNGGKAKSTNLAQALKMGANTVTAVFTPTDPDLAPSDATKEFTVVKAGQTTTSMTAVIPALPRTRSWPEAKVSSAYGTAVAGYVKYVLKRNGVEDPHRNGGSQQVRHGQEGVQERQQAGHLHGGRPLPRARRPSSGPATSSSSRSDPKATRETHLTL